MPLSTPSFPNQFGQTVNFTSTGADVGFGFTAALVKVYNDSAKSIYVNLQSTTGATTGPNMYELRACSGDDFYDLGVGIGGLSFVATSSGGNVRIGAWG